MSKVIDLNSTDRPAAVALITAIEDSIEEIGNGKMTHAEILGVLDIVSKSFYMSFVLTLEID